MFVQHNYAESLLGNFKWIITNQIPTRQTCRVRFTLRPLLLRSWKCSFFSRNKMHGGQQAPTLLIWRNSLISLPQSLLIFLTVLFSSTNKSPPISSRPPLFPFLKESIASSLMITDPLLWHPWWWKSLKVLSWNTSKQQLTPSNLHIVPIDFFVICSSISFALVNVLQQLESANN